MTRTRILALGALSLVAAACAPSIPQTPPVARVATAVFDPTTGEIPLPNDLARSALGLAGLPDGAQKDLLLAFNDAGGFPGDQEVAITIGLLDQAISGTGQVTASGPSLDLATLDADTFFVWGLTAAGAGEVPTDPVTADDVAVGAAGSTLTLHHQGRRPWEPGLYYVFLRGGANGLHTADGRPVYASQVFNLVAQGEDMTREANLAILKAQLGTYEAAYQNALALNGLIRGYSTAPAPGVPSAFSVADARFPHQELAALSTFTIAPRVTQVDLDPARGLVPLPIDLLRTPGPGGTLTPLAACTLAGGTLAANGTCSSAAAAGFAALDGFGTTAPILAPTNDLVDASTVTGDTVQLWDLSTTPPTRVDPTTYLTEPCEVTDSGLSTAIVLQPAGLSACDASSPFRTRPLKDATDYAVVVTTGVKDKTGRALGLGTVGRILLFTHPVAVGGRSALLGIDDATAQGLEAMRLQLVPVLAASGLARTDLAMAYTFRTQTILSTAAQLGALPYAQDAATALPGPVTSYTPAAAFARYGVDPTAVPSGNLGEILETSVTTFNLLDPATGAFSATLAAAAETVQVLVATPRATNPNLAACPGALSALRCAPVVVFRHGFGGGRADMLTVADGLAAKGLVVVATDAAKHGDRALCAKGDVTATLQGNTVPVCADLTSACVSPLPAGAQGDEKPPGTCGGVGYANRPVSTACLADPVGCGWTGQEGIPFVSGSFLVSANFFRTRDSLRQDAIDQSQLVRALAFVPSGGPPTGHAVFDHMAGGGVVIDPGKVGYVGQSLGALQGAMNAATNPRVSAAVLNVGGGTIVDIFTTSPAFEGATDQLLAGLGIAPGTSAYLQFLAVAKTLLDPADPVNYAGHLKANTLPNLLGTGDQAPKAVLSQAAFCDQTVPNPFSYLLAATASAAPLPGGAGFGGPGDFQLFMTGATAPDPAAFDSCTGGFGSTPLTPWAVGHSVLTGWTDAAQTAAAQASAAGFLADPAALPPSLVVLP
jgi:dienelactone hydrolase